jgi:hypothetical protein
MRLFVPVPSTFQQVIAQRITEPRGRRALTAACPGVRFRPGVAGQASRMPRLSIVRPPLSYGGSQRRYKILLDGEEVGRIAAGGQRALPVDPGRHRLRASLDCFGGNDLVLELGPNEERSVAVEPNGDSTWDLLRTLRRIPGQWLRLTVLNDAH